MKKTFLLACAFTLLSGGFATPLFAATEYVTQSDLDRVNEEIRTSNYRYCPGYWIGRSAEDVDRANADRWMTELMMVGDQARGAYARYTVPFKGKNVSMVLPYQANWTLRGKQVRPYLLTGNLSIEVGPLDFVDSTIQDYTCSLLRKYSISVEKGSIQSKTKALQQEIKTLKASGSRPDASEDLPTVSLGTAIALVPSVLQNSGGFSLQHDRVVVNLSGGWVMTISSKGGYRATVDPTMLRIAVSAR